MLKLLLLLNPVYVTLFWCIVLCTNRKKGYTPKIFLGKFMLVTFLLYLTHLFYFLPLPGIYHFADPFYHLFSLMVCPMYYVYIRLLTVDHSLSFKKHSLFFLPPMVMFVLYGVGLLLMSKEEHLNYLYNYLVSEVKLSGVFLYQKTIYTINRFIFVLQGLIYIWFSIDRVVKNKKNIHNYYANTENDSLDKIQWLNISLFITIVGGIILAILGKENFIYREDMLIIPSIVFSIMLFVIGWLGNMQRSVIVDLKEDKFREEQEEYVGDANTDQLVLIKQNVESLFDEEKIYLNKNLTIWEVARVIGTNRTYVSMVINNDFKQNFSSFVNSYRVKHAKMLLAKNTDICKSDLAEMSGFGSVLSMNRAFKCFDE